MILSTIRLAADSVRQDFRFGVRQLGRSMAFTAPAIISLALGISVNSATFSIVSALLLRPLGATGSEDLVRIGRSVNADGSFRSSSRAELLYLREHTTTFSEILGESLETLTIGSPAATEIVSAETVTENYFSGLGVILGEGRGFAPEEEESPVVVVSDGFRRRYFAGTSDVVGRTIAVNTVPLTIIGVAPAEFTGTFPGVSVDVWVPYLMGAILRPNGDSDVSLQLMGRLRAGASLAQARSELTRLSESMSLQDPSRDRSRGFVIATARGAHPGIARALQFFLVFLMSIVGVVLLIACVNVAGILLARSSSRTGEFALRRTVGATTSRMVSQLFIENLILAFCGAAVGVVIASWLVGVVDRLALTAGPTGAPIFLNLTIDSRVLWFTAIISVMSALVFGLTPALQATRVDLMAGLKTSSDGDRRARFRGALVTIQIALSVTLLIAAVLLSRSVGNAFNIDLGFRPDAVQVASFNIELPGYNRARIERFYMDLLQRVRLVPGIQEAAMADFIPMGDRGDSIEFVLRSPGSSADGQRLRTAYNRVSDRYFATIGQPLLQGRDFTEQDRAGSAPVVIINEAMARRFGPDESAVGKRIRFESESIESEVIGVVADARYASYNEQVRPMIILPAFQRFGSSLTLHVRTTDPTTSGFSSLSQLVREIDVNVAVQRAGPMRQRMVFSLLPAEIARHVFAIAGGMGLLMAAVGLYGLISFVFEQRTKEIGLRLALGATRQQVLWEIAGGVLKLALSGTMIGLALAATTMRLMSALLYGVNPFDPFTFTSIALLLAGVVAAAAYLGARKALKVEPAVALRHD